MKNGAIFMDSFSGAAASLPKGKRELTDILRTLQRHPRVSTFDMSECGWLWRGISDLKKHGLVRELDEPYPWHRYALTDAGLAAVAPNANSASK